jgi:hypothetical protein
MLYGIKDAANMTIVSNDTDKPVLYANYAKTSTIEFTSESVYAYNKSTKAIRWDTNREGTFRTEMEIFELKWIALLFGTSLASSTTSVWKREVLSVQAGGAGASLSEVPKSGTLLIFKLDDDDLVSHGAEQTAGTPINQENTYSISTKALTFNATTFTQAGKVVCYYMLDGTHNTFTVDNVSFPGGYKIYADSAIRGTDQVDTYVQYQLLNAKPKSNVSLTMDTDNVCRLTIEWDLLADASGNLMTYVEV